MFDTARTLNENQDRLARLLVEANRTETLLHPEALQLAPLTEAEALEVSWRVWAALGHELGGFKVGATARDNIRTLGAHRPMLGRLRRDRIFRAPYTVGFDKLMAPVTECEFAFELAADLPAGRTDWPPGDIAAEIARVFPAIEIAERRVQRVPGYPYTQLIADNAAGGRLVLGAPLAWAGQALNAIPVTLLVDDVVVARGDGSAVMGDPLASLAWVANEAARLGHPVRAGDILTTGSCTGMKPAERGTRQTARFGGLGEVVIDFR
ncbi:hypothetical protein EJV46_20890 [Roseococcus sp. SYP-B2431]|uniref:2-keto-4-pentenoate hydratase n=1 Tax=Roseococcus sp. SYP-B2431 TaxID=2496640 RepID=UPI00103F7B07|nr:fumarylacetoacetate hydrolase family protein [Roseococcus sp. SYP-B2431]TCH96438.1 hypothetical protein EJV46_20890 [Roseococcus sp. SYP-B2431]